MNLAERRRWFDAHANDGPLGPRFTCPCCGYPTLDERSGYDICVLCHWEDDGQDDDSADAVWGGPNGWLSLSEARRRFQTHSIHLSYARENEVCSDIRPDELRILRALLDAFDAMPGGSPTDQARLWLVIKDCERRLRQLR